jgi:hypothetical protein
VATGKTWGGTFVDSFLVALQEDLATTNFDPPPTGLQGLIMLPTGGLAGFLGNEVYLSEPNQPHAWPYTYALDHDVRALGVVDGGLFVLTDHKPVLLAGTSPGAMAPTVLEVPFACQSGDGVAQIGTVGCYPTAHSFVLVSALGAKEITREIFDEEDWEGLNPSTMVAFNWRNRYVAFYTSPDGTPKSIMFDPEKPGAGVVEFIGMAIGGVYEDHGTGDVYIATGHDIARWDGGEYLTYTWKSKPYDLPRPMAMTTVQVLGDAYPAQVSVYRDGVLQCRVLVGSPRAQRLPNARRGIVYEVEVQNNGEIREVLIANSMGALQKL